MTFNEFKMCCILFCKAFEGKKYGDVVKDCHEADRNLIISKQPEFIHSDFILYGSFVWYFSNLKILKNITNEREKLITFSTVKDFLN